MKLLIGKLAWLSVPLILVGLVAMARGIAGQGTKMKQVAQMEEQTGTVLGDTAEKKGRVLAEQASLDYQLSVNVPAKFARETTFEDVVEFLKNITAPNIIYSVKAGSGISVTSGQNPTIASTGVLSLQSKTGALSLEAGSGISLDGLKITNSDTGSSQNIFKKFAVTGQTDVEADGNADTLTFVGSGITITTDATNDKVTFTSTSPDYSQSGWTDGGTNLYLTTSTDKVGIGTSSPSTALEVSGATTLGGVLSVTGNTTLGDATTDTITFTGRVANGTSLLPITDLGSDLGSSALRFNNIYVANVNSNASSSFSGQTTFTYEPTTTAYTEASVIINPTAPIADGYLLGLGVAGYQRAGIDEDGDLSIGYSGLVSIPASDYPLSIYNHSTTRIAYFDTSGNLNIGGSIISGSGISASGDLTIAAGYSIIPSADQVNALSIGNAASTDFVSFDTTNSRVGVGTTTPDSKLHVVGGDTYFAPDTSYTFDNASAGEDVYVNDNLEVDGNTYLATLYLGGTQVTSSATELNILDGVTSSTAELNYLDGTTVTTGGVMFGNGTYMTQDATNFFWDDSSNELGIGTNSPSAFLHVLGTTEQLRLGYDASNYLSFTVDSAGNMTLADTGTNVAVLGATTAEFYVPTTFSSAGDVSVAYDLIFTNQTASQIASYGPLSIISGESFENLDLTLKTYGTGNLVVDLSGTGDLQVVSADPSILFDTATATDTDYWMGIIEDAGGDDDDVFVIGEGTTPGSNNYLAVNTSGYVGIGTTAPAGPLEIDTGTASGVAVTIDQDDVDQVALDLDINNTAGNIINLDWGGATTQTAAMAGLLMDFTNVTADGTNALYGLHINDHVGATASTEYAIYQQGTNWDYGLYLEDAAYIGGALTQAGNITINKADPSLIFDTVTATDTDFWMGVIEDAGGDDDDLFQIGDGTTPGTSPYLTIDTSGQVGIGLTNPANIFSVSGGVNSGSKVVLLAGQNNAYPLNLQTNGGNYIYFDRQSGGFTGNIAQTTGGTTSNVIQMSGSEGAALARAGTNMVWAGSNLVVFGAGEDGTPIAVTLRGPEASGSNKAGANVTFDASNGTGTGGSGNLIFRTAPTGTTGTTANTLTEIMRITTAGYVGIGTTTPTSKLHVSGAVVGKALAIFDETGDGALLTASAGGTPKVTIQHNGLVDATAGGLASFIKAGTVSDVDFTDAAVDGLLAFDSTNHRLYFREGGAWSYINRTGGFQIPDYEVGNMVVGDYLVPYVDSTMSDGAVHGLYRRFTDAKNELLSDIYGAIASLIARLEGLKEKFVTKESHQEKLCVGKEEDEVCLDGAQLRGVLDNIASLNASVSAIIAATQSAELTATPEAEPTATPTVTPEATPTEAPVITEPEPATGSGNVGEPGEATESGITE